MHVSWKWSHQITAFFLQMENPWSLLIGDIFWKTSEWSSRLDPPFVHLLRGLICMLSMVFVSRAWLLCVLHCLPVVKYTHPKFKPRLLVACSGNELCVDAPCWCPDPYCVMQKNAESRWKQFHLHPHRSPHLSRRDRGPVCRLIPFFWDCAWAASWCFNPCSSKWMTELWWYILLEYWTPRK